MKADQKQSPVTPKVFAGKKTTRRKAAGILIGLIASAILWTFDPWAWRVRLNFPSAKIEDWNDYWYFIPAILHPYCKDPQTIDDGYLFIEISDQTVDMDKFVGIPFCHLSLNRCKILNPHFFNAISDGRRDVEFNDCDFSSDPSAVKWAPTPYHIMFETDPA